MTCVVGRLGGTAHPFFAVGASPDRRHARHAVLRWRSGTREKKMSKTREYRSVSPEFGGLWSVGAAAALLFLMLAGAGAAHADDFAGGSGEPNDPYQIATADQLLSIGADPNLLDKSFVLIADIDLDPNLPAGRIFTQAVIAPDTDAADPVFQGPAFRGDLNGRTYAIRNLTISSQASHYLGLFGLLASEASVRSLRFENAQITGGENSEALGALAGSNHGSVADCTVTATVCGSEFVGGLVGYNAGTIINCHATTDVSSSHPLHGRGGGLVGSNGGVLANSSADARVLESGVLGGLSGGNHGMIWRCFARGEVTGGDFLGGLVGSATEGMISDCYAFATVSGTYGVRTGGLIGYYAGGAVINCYAAGAVYNGDEAEEWDWGGLIGWSSIPGPIIVNCFWDVESSLSTVS